MHHDLAGVDAFASMYVDAFGRLLDALLDEPRPGRPTAVRAEHDGFGRTDVAR